jgi:hypothetical protein
MHTTYQHRVVAQYLQNTFGRLNNSPFSSSTSIEEDLCRQRLVLRAGDYLVVAIDRNRVRYGKVNGLSELAAFPSHSIVIPFHELERAFYEHHTEYIEL